MKYLVQTKTGLLTIFDSKDSESLISDLYTYFNGESSIISNAINRCDNIKESAALYNEITKDLDCKIESIYELGDVIV